MSRNCYRYTGQGQPPIFRTPMRKLGPNVYEFGGPVNHPDFEPVDVITATATKAEDTEDSKEQEPKPERTAKKHRNREE